MKLKGEKKKHLFLGKAFTIKQSIEYPEMYVDEFREPIPVQAPAKVSIKVEADTEAAQEYLKGFEAAVKKIQKKAGGLVLLPKKKAKAPAPAKPEAKPAPVNSKRKIILED